MNELTLYISLAFIYISLYIWQPRWRCFNLFAICYGFVGIGNSSQVRQVRVGRTNFLVLFCFHVLVTMSPVPLCVSIAHSIISHTSVVTAVLLKYFRGFVN